VPRCDRGLGSGDTRCSPGAGRFPSTGRVAGGRGGRGRSPALRRPHAPTTRALRRRWTPRRHRRTVGLARGARRSRGAGPRAGTDLGTGVPRHRDALAGLAGRRPPHSGERPGAPVPGCGPRAVGRRARPLVCRSRLHAPGARRRPRPHRRPRARGADRRYEPRPGVPARPPAQARGRLGAAAGGTGPVRVGQPVRQRIEVPARPVRRDLPSPSPPEDGRWRAAALDLEPLADDDGDPTGRTSSAWLHGTAPPWTRDPDQPADPAPDGSLPTLPPPSARADEPPPF
jgi:hypothetical protein